jgi:hypothetical protein
MGQEDLDAAPPRRPKVFLGPMEVAGYYTALGHDFRALGIEAVVVDLYSNRFQYTRLGEQLPLAARPAAAAIRLRSSAQRWYGLWRIISALATVPVFLWAIIRFDTFVFGFRTSFFGLRELPILRFLGKRLVFVFHGSDVRPPYMDGQDMSVGGGMSIADCAALAIRKKHQIRWIERYASVVISHPLYSHFLERPYVRALALGMPGDPEAQVDPIPARTPSERTRILHSPSNPEAKGTAAIRRAIKSIADDHLAIDYVEVIDAPHHRVLSEIEASDFVVDQIYSDTPMAGFATEAAWRARPAIVGSYGWDEMRRLLPADELPPVRECDPDEVEQAIRDLIYDSDHRQALGQRAKDFIANHSGAGQVAERFVRVFHGDIPAEWMSDPGDVRYCLGCGLPRDRVQDLVRSMIDKYGRSSLQLEDKPVLEALLADLATGPISEQTAPDRR